MEIRSQDVLETGSGIGYLRTARRFFQTIALVVAVTFTMWILTPTVVVAQQTNNDATGLATPDIPADDQAYGSNSDEAQFARILKRLERRLARLEEKLYQRLDATLDIDDLKKLKRQIQKNDQKLVNNFEKTRAFIERKNLPAIMLDRYQETVTAYREALAELLGVLDSAEAATSDSERLAWVRDALRQLREQRSERPHQSFDPGELPFRTPSPEAREPVDDPADLRVLLTPPEPIRVAARNGLSGLLWNTATQEPQPEHLAPSEDVQITDEIKALARQLDNSPVAIYRWVYNNVAFVPTYGSIQGAQMTLTAKRGNAFDIASLLIALLRAAGIHARYVYGTVQIPIDRVMNWVGNVKTPQAALELMGQGGIPVSGVAEGGMIKYAKLEHVWVEAWVDFHPSRGSRHRQGDSWVALDGSFKQYTYQPALDVLSIAAFDVDTTLDQVLGPATINHAEASATGLDLDAARTAAQSAQSRLQAFFDANRPQTTLAKVFDHQIINAIEWPVLPSGLPYQPIAVIDRWAVLPANLRHTVTLDLFNSAVERSLGSPSLTFTLSLPRLNIRRLGITFSPASAADAEVIENQLLENQTESDSSELPLYLIRVKPLIKLDDEILAEGGAVNMGSDQFLNVVMRSPQGSDTLAYSQVAGDEMVVVVNAAGISPEQVSQRFNAINPHTAAENLHQIGLHYWAEADLFAQLWATVYETRVVRLPSAGLFSSPLSVIYSFGIPHKGYYLKRSVDIKRNIHAVVGASREVVREVVSQLGILHSYLESSILEQMIYNWQGTGLSAAQVLLDANAQNIPIYQIDQNNSAQVLAKLDVPEDAMTDIRSALQVGLQVIVPERVPTKAVGTKGIGYILRDAETGAGSYRIVGGLDGGESSGPCAQPEPRPLVHAIKAILITILIVAALAAIGWAVGGLVGGAIGVGGRALAPVLANIMASLGVSELVFALTAGNDICEPIMASNKRNKDPIHDQCADEYPPNEFYGFDACVAGKNFDAISGSRSILWEVKTENFNNNSPFLRARIPQKWVTESVNKDIPIIKSTCAHRKYSYHFLVGDPRFLPLFLNALQENVQPDPDEVISGPGYPLCTSEDNR